VPSGKISTFRTGAGGSKQNVTIGGVPAGVCAQELETKPSPHIKETQKQEDQRCTKIWPQV